MSDEWRTFQLVELTGWTFEQIDAAPAVRLDRLIAIAKTRDKAAHRKAEADARKYQSKGR